MKADGPESRRLAGYTVNVLPDVIDFRDLIYSPPLIRIADEVIPEPANNILDQGQEGACTGFGLAAVIDRLNARRGRAYGVSARMLYECARRYDEWAGEDYTGSSCRGAIKGWYAMGVCREQDWTYQANDPGHLTVEAAKGARENRVGAYYRLRHRLADFHAALCETGAIFVSANVHTGWQPEAIAANDSRIPLVREPEQPAGHAFAVVGYNADGFLVQNSWGKTWGKDGVALWSYEDWYENIRDAWAFRLSLSTPAIWQISTREKPLPEAQTSSATETPVRGEIAGHFVHLDDGDFDHRGRYWSDLQDVMETADLLLGSDKYNHLLLYAHGGLNTPTASARRIRGMKPIFKENGIYPFHFMYDTGLVEELKDVIARKAGLAEARTGGISDWTNAFIERTLRTPGRSVWREMKHGARAPFEENRAGWQTLQALIGKLLAHGKPIKIHAVGHSTGGIMLAYLLEALEVIAPSLRVASVSLLAPACTVDLYRSHYHPLLSTEPGFFGIEKMLVYNLSDELEQDDQVAKLYQNSLLYLVSRSFEEDRPERLLGMQRYSRDLDRRVRKLVEFVYSKGEAGKEVRSMATTHGGFDNDIPTMNHILSTVLGRKPKVRFSKRDLDY